MSTGSENRPPEDASPPTSSVVVARVVGLVQGEWPRGLGESLAWLQRKGLAADAGLEVLGPGWYVSAAGTSSGGWPSTEWRLWDGELVGLTWHFHDFTPAGQPLLAGAAAIAASFDASWPGNAGPDFSPEGIAQTWRAGGFAVDLYYHAPRGHPAVPAAVQLQVAVRERAEREERGLAQASSRPSSAAR